MCVGPPKAQVICLLFSEGVGTAHSELAATACRCLSGGSLDMSLRTTNYVHPLSDIIICDARREVLCHPNMCMDNVLNLVQMRNSKFKK